MLFIFFKYILILEILVFELSRTEQIKHLLYI